MPSRINPATSSLVSLFERLGLPGRSARAHPGDLTGAEIREILGLALDGGLDLRGVGRLVDLAVLDDRVLRERLGNPRLRDLRVALTP